MGDENDQDVSSLATSNFEALLGNLESVVTRLEGGELSLEESLTDYEKGVGLVRAAQGRLDVMNARLEELLTDGSLAAFDDDDEDDDEDDEA